MNRQYNFADELDDDYERYYEELRDERERLRLERENELDGYVPPEEED